MLLPYFHWTPRTFQNGFVSVRNHCLHAKMASMTYALGGGAGKTGTAAPGSSKLIQGRWRLAAASYDTRSWGDIATGSAPIPRSEPVDVAMTSLERDFRLWQDMVENPAQYGDDIEEWLDLNDQLMVSRKAWKIERYWRKQQEMEEAKLVREQTAWKRVYSVAAREAASLCMRRWIRRDVEACLRKFRRAATIIQAAVRGHQIRVQLPNRDCCMCLAHRICSLKSDVGFLCNECAAEGPHVDHTGPLADPWDWYRADHVRMWVKT